jgi:hypothetical protein
MGSYSTQDIEDAFRCAGHPQDTPTLQVAKGKVFSHLEGRCRCPVGRCPACGERESNGRKVHLFHCPMLRNT